jgi:3-amino-4-hydroxybenzoic acid synthase
MTPMNAVIDAGQSVEPRQTAANATRRSAGSPDSLLLWFDTRRAASPVSDPALLERALHWRYNAVVLYPDNIDQVGGAISNRIMRVLHVDEVTQLESICERDGSAFEAVSSANPAPLLRAKALGYLTCLRAHVEDRLTLHQCIQQARGHRFLLVSFNDPTNIPLELVIASLQPTNTALVKEIASGEDIDDAVVSLGVMEVGADGVMFTPTTHSHLSDFMARIEASWSPSVRIESATVVRNVPLGMGTRSCIDLTTLFRPTEGMLVGSTSHGGILCCPEVFHLPYMELRPFRVNAGAVHSYVYNFGDRTAYMSELKAGDSMMVVDMSGKTRKAYVGRAKTEVRPLRLIEVEFAGGSRANIILQDDWHVRIYSDQGLPLNVTEIRPGARVLGHQTEPGRHVGIRVDEHIVEA